MRQMLPAAATQSRSILTALVLGTAFASGTTHAAPAPPSSGPSSEAASDPTAAAIRDITRYCQVCWRNARLPADRWPDCTQQVFARLLETVPREHWGLLLVDDGTEQRREFVRAIDAVKKRTQRARKFADMPVDHADPRNVDATRADQREELDLAVRAVLSGRQQRIVELSVTGWAVPEIAAELGTTPERVSDEKYKAIRKLRVHLGVDA